MCLKRHCDLDREIYCLSVSPFTEVNTITSKMPVQVFRLDRKMYSPQCMKELPLRDRKHLKERLLALSLSYKCLKIKKTNRLEGFMSIGGFL